MKRVIQAFVRTKLEMAGGHHFGKHEMIDT